MSTVHGLFIPDQEYLVDLAGLVAFLGEKVAVANVCLWCNGRGRGLRSLEAVRRHMLDKGHTQLAYDAEEDRLELAEYYDFRPSYPDYDPSRQKDETDEKDVDMRSVADIQFGDNEYELVLPSGARIGHRALKVYYNQRLDVVDEQESEKRGRSFESTAVVLRREQEQQALARMTGPMLREAKKVGARSGQVQRELQARLGVKANKLQRHFRAQILF